MHIENPRRIYTHDTGEKILCGGKFYFDPEKQYICQSGVLIKDDDIKQALIDLENHELKYQILPISSFTPI